MSDGAIKTLKDRRKLHLAEIEKQRGYRVEAVEVLDNIDRQIARCEGVVAEMEEGIISLGGEID